MIELTELQYFEYLKLQELNEQLRAMSIDINKYSKLCLKDCTLTQEYGSVVTLDLSFYCVREQ